MKKLNTEKLKNNLLDGIEKTETFIQKHKTNIVLGTIGVLAGTTAYYHAKYQNAVQVGDRLATAVDDLGYTPAVVQKFWDNLMEEKMPKAVTSDKED